MHAKRITLGLATITTGLAISGYYFYQSAVHTKTGSLQNAISILAASGGLIGHGIEQMRLGFGNHDAKNIYAKHLAISHLIADAKQKAVENEPV